MSESDGSFDRLLAGALEARAGAAPAAGCLDAETLAAWADGALDARERARAEAHAADCSRCQALLAAMVRTEPPPSVSKSPWRWPALGWLVPVTMAVAALVVWVAVPSRVPVQRSAPAETEAQPQDQVARAPETAPLAAPAPDRRAEEPSGKPIGKKASPEPENVARAAPAAVPAEPRARQDAAPLEKTLPAAPQSANALSDRTVVGGAAGGAPGAGAPAAARALAFANAPEVVIVSSNPATRFRLLPGGGVQRTADGGSTWRSEVTGATETLTAGSSPSPSVCWLVGPSGIVLLSTDGRSWRRLPFPEAVGLRSVAAVDTENATVATVDGRTFVTADGGLTWSRPPDF